MQGKDDGSGGAVWSAAIASGALVAQIVAGKATRDTLFLTHFGLKLLPAAMIGAALLSSLSVIGISRALTKYGPARIVPVTFGLGAVLFLVEWWLCLRNEHAASIVVYAHTAVFGAAGNSAFWSLVNERFDPHAAKRIVGRIASGGTIGGVVGGVAAWRASAQLSVPMMLALLAGMNVVGLWGALRTAPSEVRRAGPVSSAVVAPGGTRALRETPYLRDLAYLVLTGAMINALLDWLLSAQATEVYGKGPQLLGFFALFNMAVGVASFVMQTSVTRPILEKKGLGSTIKSQPGSIAAGVVLALVAPYFVSILLLRFLEAVTRSSLYRSAYELFYTPLPPAKKRATKTIIDVGVDRIGTLVGSAALLGIAHLSHDAATKTVLFISLALAGICWYVASRLQDGYVSALASSLKSGAVALSDDAEDLTTKKTLAETTALLDREKLLQRIEEFQKQKDARIALGQTAGSLGASGLRTDAGSSKDVVEASVETTDPVLVKAAAIASGDVARIKKILAQPVPPKLAPYVVPLLANDAVVRDVVRSLRKTAGKTTGLLLDHLLDPEVDVRVRRRIPRVLKVCRTQRAASGLLFGLRDPTFEVRVQVGLALAQIAEESAIVISPEVVFDIVLHELTAGRSGWSEESSGLASVDADDAARASGSLRPPSPEKRDDALYRGLSHVFTVLGLVLEREPLSIAYRALRSDDAGLRGTAFEYLDVVLPPSVRDVLVPLLGDVKPMSARPRPRERDSKELAAELLRSSGSLPRPRT